VVASNFSTSKIIPIKKKRKERKAGEGLGKKRSPTQFTCKLQYGKVLTLLQMEGTITLNPRQLNSSTDYVPGKRTANTKRNKVMCMNTLTVS
jgi:hypothetical protein